MWGARPRPRRGGCAQPSRAGSDSRSGTVGLRNCTGLSRVSLRCSLSEGRALSPVVRAAQRGLQHPRLLGQHLGCLRAGLCGFYRTCPSARSVAFVPVAVWAAPASDRRPAVCPTGRSGSHAGCFCRGGGFPRLPWRPWHPSWLGSGGDSCTRSEPHGAQQSWGLAPHASFRTTVFAVCPTRLGRVPTRAVHRRGAAS